MKHRFRKVWSSSYLHSGVAFFLLVFIASSLSVSAGESQRPNVLLFYADDMGLGDVGVYDPLSTIPTPNMDQIAREGIIFTDAHSSSAVCSPSRYSLLSGQHAFRSSLSDSVVRSPYAAPLLERSQYTLGEMFQRGGYSVAAFGKWHLGMSWPNVSGEGIAQPGRNTSRYTTTDVNFNMPILDGPTNHGFDYFFGIASTYNQGPYTFIQNDRVVKVPYVISPEVEVGGGVFRQGWVSDGWMPREVNKNIAKNAVEYLDRHFQSSAGKPFFMFYASTSNHWPHLPPAAVFGQRVQGEGGSDDESPSRNDLVYENDLILGELLSKIDDPNGDGSFDDSQLRNTIVVVTSDNGADRGYYSLIRGKKGELYEGGHRVPLLVRWPARIPAGRRSSALFSQLDFLASFSSLLNLPLDDNQGLDSRDLADVLLGVSEDGRDELLIERNGYSDEFAFRSGSWKLIVKKERATELYNLSEDLAETNSILSKEAGRAESLYNQYRRYRGIERTHMRPGALPDIE